MIDGPASGRTRSAPAVPSGGGGRPQPGAAAKGFAAALVVDDHPLFCDALTMTLRAVAPIAAIETAGSLAEALAAIERGPPPDLIVLDLHLPDAHGMGGLLRLRAAARAPILVVSSMSDDRVIAAAMAAGASGYVPKHSHRDVFRAALEALGDGRGYLPQGYLGPAAQDERARGTACAAGRLASLTQQQSRILELICEGKLNKQIAYDLSIAETTVKAHVTAIMRKLGVQSRTQAVLLAGEARFEALREAR